MPGAAAPAGAPASTRQDHDDHEDQEEVSTATATALLGNQLVKHDGSVVCVNRGEVPFTEEGWAFFAQVRGEAMARHLLGPCKASYGERWLRESRARFHARGAEDEWDAFLRNGGTCGGRRLYWAVMELPPGRSFPLHAHPTLEVIHVIRGALHERRMEGPPLDLAQEEGNEVPDMAPIDLSQRVVTFQDGVFPQDSININEMGSVHQSWTGPEEGCLLLCIWGGRHCNLEGARLPRGYEMGGCQGCQGIVEEEPGGGQLTKRK